MSRELRPLPVLSKGLIKSIDSELVKEGYLTDIDGWIVYRGLLQKDWELVPRTMNYVVLATLPEVDNYLAYQAFVSEKTLPVGHVTIKAYYQTNTELVIGRYTIVVEARIDDPTLRSDTVPTASFEILNVRLEDLNKVYMQYIPDPVRPAVRITFGFKIYAIAELPNFEATDFPCTGERLIGAGGDSFYYDPDATKEIFVVPKTFYLYFDWNTQYAADYDYWINVRGARVLNHWEDSSIGDTYTIFFDTRVFLNFYSYAFIMNFEEMVLHPGAFGDPILYSRGRVPNRIRWGDTGSAITGDIEMENPGVNNAGFMDLTETVGPIIGAVAFLFSMYIFKRYSVYKITYVGYPKYFTYEIVLPDLGCIASSSIVKYLDRVIFLSNNGIYALGPRGLDKLSLAIDTELFGSLARYTIQELESATIVSFPVRGEIWLHVPGSNDVWKCQIDSKAWTKTDYSDYSYTSNLTNFTLPRSSLVESNHLNSLSRNLISDDSNFSKSWTVFGKQVGSVWKVAKGPWFTYREYHPTLLFGWSNQIHVDNSTGTIPGDKFIDTQDFLLPISSRVTEFKFQASADSKADPNFGIVYVFYSIDKGDTWSNERELTIGGRRHTTTWSSLVGSWDTIIFTDFSWWKTIYPGLHWYTFPMNVTAEKIRFRFRSSDQIRLGLSGYKFTQRQRGKQKEVGTNA